ncbi:WXG100 family type VII secretion target [Micromonospora sp. SH-82]|uniref:WXG100 family type VII secretion target n=1 Tax=Micromonospora sp. SH-82 TaxID=3132938 RepID=UPI003EBA389E
MTNPLVAPATATGPTPWAGLWIAEDIELIHTGIRNGNWIDGTLGVVSAGLDALAFVTDPAGALLQYGIAWLIEHVKPLSEALDWLAGDPAQITAHAQTWRNTATHLRDTAADLTRDVRADLTDWTGHAATTYRTRTSHQHQTITTLAAAADTMATLTETTAGLVAAVRLLVRDAIATCVSRLVVYAAELVATAGLATPLVVQQVTTTVATWAARITRLLRALINSLRQLIPTTRRLTDLINKLKEALNRLKAPSADAEGLNRVRGRGSGPRMPMNLGSVNVVATKYGIDMSAIRIAINNKLSGVCGMTKPDQSVILCRDAFRSEEDLARTLEHERFHAAELRSGQPYPRTAREAEAFEDRAYAHEEQWWQNQTVRPERNR